LAGTVCESMATWPKIPSLRLQAMNDRDFEYRPVIGDEVVPADG